MNYCVLDIGVAPAEIVERRIVKYLRGRNIAFDNPVFSRVVVVGVKPEGGGWPSGLLGTTTGFCSATAGAMSRT